MLLRAHHLRHADDAAAGTGALDTEWEMDECGVYCGEHCDFLTFFFFFKFLSLFSSIDVFLLLCSVCCRCPNAAADALCGRARRTPIEVFDYTTVSHICFLTYFLTLQRVPLLH
jgi:hypothetical protein